MEGYGVDIVLIWFPHGPPFIPSANAAFRSRRQLGQGGGDFGAATGIGFRGSHGREIAYVNRAGTVHRTSSKIGNRQFDRPIEILLHIEPVQRRIAQTNCAKQFARSVPESDQMRHERMQIRTKGLQKLILDERFRQLPFGR